MSFLAPVLDNYRKTFEALGLDADALFEEAGISADEQRSAAARIDYSRVDRLRALAAKRGRAPALGIALARYLRPAHLGTMGLAWLSSRSLRTSLERFQRFGRLFNDQVRVDLHEENGFLVYGLSVDVPSENDAVRFDYGLATSVAMCRMTAGDDFNPARVCFTHSAPDDPAEWFGYFRCPVQFDDGPDRMYLRLEDADRLLPTFNPQLGNMLDQEMIRYLARHDKDDIVNRVRAAIIEQLPSGGISDGSVAESLHLTERTLHRRLSEHDTSFRSLLNDVRNELALRYVADPHLTLTEISFLLGFSEVSAFSRAYRRWTGEPPSKSRAAEKSS